MAYIKLERRDIAEIRNWLRRARPMMKTLDALLPTSGPGRNVNTTMFFVGLLAAARHNKSAHLSDAIDHLNRLTWTDRRDLGLGEFEKVTYRQFQHTFELVSRLIDPYHRTQRAAPKNAEERASANAADRTAREAAARLSEDLWDALIKATVPAQFLDHPDLAVDTTQVPSWKAPANHFGSDIVKKRAKAAAAERKALAARANSETADQVTTDILEAALRVAGGHVEDRSPIDRGEPRGKRLTGYTDEDYDGPPEGNPSFPNYPVQVSPYDSASAGWIGNKDPRKATYGQGLHVGVLIPTRGSNQDIMPLVAVMARLTTTTENPPATLVSMLAERQRRSDSSGAKGPATGDLAADNAFFPSVLPALNIKALGANPIFNLHGRNQQGCHHEAKDGVIWIDGRPYCSCMPERLRNLVYPRFPEQDKERAAYRLLIEEREQYEFKTKGSPRPDGSRLFFTPHNNKCLRCNTSANPCCQAGTVTFYAQQLALYQHEIFGSPEWAASFGRRALVEGYFGVLKAVSGLRGDNARFHNHGKVGLAYLLLICSTNLRLVDTWRKRCKRKAAMPNKPTRRERRRRKSIQDFSPMTPTTPSSGSVADAPGKPPGPLDFLDDQ